MSERLQQAGRNRKIVSKQSKNKRNRELKQLFQQGNKKEIDRAVTEWQELNMGGRECFDRELGKLICKSDSFWQSDNIFYKSYSEASKLKENQIKLMFFQVGRLDIDPKSRDIWSPIENFNWTNYIDDLKRINLKPQDF